MKEVFPVTQQQQLVQHFGPLRSQRLSQYLFQYWKATAKTYWFGWRDWRFDFQQDYVRTHLSIIVGCPVSYHQPLENRYDYTHHTWLYCVLDCLFHTRWLFSDSFVKIITVILILNRAFIYVRHLLTEGLRSISLPNALPWGPSACPIRL